MNTLNKYLLRQVAGGAVVFFALTISPTFVTTAVAETHGEAKENEREAAEHDPDDTGRNARDVNDHRKTADDQAFAGGDIEVLASIRRAVVDNDSLSTYAHNVKIIVENKVVTLRGPVRAASEKEWIAMTTAKLAPSYKVVNQLEVAPDK